MPGSDLSWTSEMQGGDEISWLFESDGDILDVMIPFTRRGLELNEKIVYLGNAGSIEAIANLLRTHSPEIKQAIEAGALEWMRVDQGGRPKGTPISAFLIELLQVALDKARQQGYTRLRICGDLGSMLENDVNPDGSLVETEQRLNCFVHDHQCLALWQYDARRLSIGTLLTVVTTHPSLIIGSAPYKPEAFLKLDEFQDFQHTALPGYRWLQKTVKRQEAKKDLLGSDERWFQVFFDQAEHFACLVSPDGIVVGINQAALRHGPQQRADVIGRPLWSILGWSASSQAQDALKRAIHKTRTEGTARIEQHLNATGKQERTLDLSFRQITGTDGKVRWILIEGWDATEYKSTETRLIESGRLMEAALNSAPIALFMVDQEGIIRILTGQGVDSLREWRGDLTGSSIYDVFKERPDLIRYIERALAGEVFSATVDFNNQVFSTQYMPYVRRDGDIIGAIGVATNVTHHQEALDALNKSEARFRTIFNEAGIGIALKDLEGRVIAANPAFQKMLGYTAQELLHKTFIDLTHPADLMQALELYNSMFDGQRDSFRMEKRYLRKDNHIVWGRITASLVRTPDGKPEAALLMVEDITEKKQIESELQEVQRLMLQYQEVERLHLAQDLHDGPLQELYGISYQIRALQNTEGLESALAGLSQVDDMLQKQIQTLRAFCGELRPPTLAPFGLEKAIQSNVEHFRQSHPEIKVHLDLMHDGKTLPEKVRMALFRIYQELMNNIARHSRATQVTVRFHLDEEQVILEIEDNGRGFNMPKRLVELGRSGHLGLIGALERSEAIGGQMKISSNPGDGTLIQVRVPRIFHEEMWNNESIVNEAWRVGK